MRLLSSALLLFLGCSVFFPSASSASSICEYAECKETADEILSNLNEKVDPCQDFYEYSCGGKGMNIMSLTKVESVMKQRLASDLYADDNLKNHGSKAVRQAKEVYDDCIKKGSSSCESLARAKCRYAFVRVYMDKYFPVAEHRAVSRLILNIRNTYVSDIVNNIKWLDPQTKKTVLKNLTELQLNIGYPDWLLNDKELDLDCQGVQHDRWPMNPLEVNAQYAGSENGGQISKYFW